MTGVRLAGDDEVVRDKDWLRAAQSAGRLAWASMAGMSVEGAIGLWQGLATGSIVLTGWALGSGVEGLASGIVVWRFSRGRTLSEMAERRAQLWVAVSFWVLAPYVAAESVRELQTGHHSEPTAIGIGLAAVALIAMPLLGSAKHRLGSRLGSAATAGEGTQNYICAAGSRGSARRVVTHPRLETRLVARPCHRPRTRSCRRRRGHRVLAKQGP